MTFLTSLTDFALIELTGDTEQHPWFIEDCYQELENRIPFFEPEYDAEGRIITSEIMGYDEGEVKQDDIREPTFFDIFPEGA